MLKMVDGTGIIGLDMVCPLGISTPQPPNYDRVELEGTGMLVLPNSLDAPLERLELGGKTEQVQTTGAQLWKSIEDKTVNGVEIKTDEFGTIHLSGTCSESVNVLFGSLIDTKTCTLSCVSTGSFPKNTNIKISAGALSILNNSSASASVTGIVTGDLRLRLDGDFTYNNCTLRIMLNEGSTATPHEPYTGNKPSPSTEYPQEIKNVGKWNEETQKYEVDVKVTGKNLFDSEKAKDKSKWTPCARNANYVEIAVYVGTGSTVTASNNVKIDNPVYCYGVALKSSEDIKYFICYPGYPNSKDTHTFTATEDYIYVRCNKTSLSDVIGVVGGLQIEIGTIRTEFEPYKEQNVQIALDEPLRGVGEYKDTITKDGVARRIKQITVDEKSNLMFYRESKNTVGYLVKVPDATQTNYIYSVISDRFVKTQYIDNNDTNGVVTLYAKQIIFRVSKEIANSVDALKEWLANNNITFNYVLESPIIEPLPESLQAQLSALHSENGTTHVFVDSGKVEAGIKVTYRKEI